MKKKMTVRGTGKGGGFQQHKLYEFESSTRSSSSLVVSVPGRLI